MCLSNSSVIIVGVAWFGQLAAGVCCLHAAATKSKYVIEVSSVLLIAGKAPILEDDDASTAAANAAAVDAADAAAAAGRSSSTFTQKLGQLFGMSEGQQQGALRDVPARQWRPVFHPAFTIAGTQPTMVIPQVRQSGPSYVHFEQFLAGILWAACILCIV